MDSQGHMGIPPELLNRSFKKLDVRFVSCQGSQTRCIQQLRKNSCGRLLVHVRDRTI